MKAPHPRIEFTAGHALQIDQIANLIHGAVQPVGHLGHRYHPKTQSFFLLTHFCFQQDSSANYSRRLLWFLKRKAAIFNDS
jgi:hypothetical protein